ncbi:hypothetical protein [Maritalea porphyrae]|uniref:hypothetical protein n=1 Tax=Maritalea porphyrae TaxID=880732 RepID=UPI0022AE974B|nr:hypothetical protein [Maritalea porphyrae]MCZ4274139.1 hypothetical protein [Maritalea porphyrae]
MSILHANIPLKMIGGLDPVIIWPSYLTRSIFSAAIIFGITLGAPSCEAANWSTNGSFTLEEKFSNKSDWTFGQSNWKSQIAFEKSIMGQEFKLAALPKKFEGKTKLDQLFSLIASVEAPHRQYDAVHHKAKIKPPHNPTKLTLGEVFEWIEATPNQFHAIGRYQFIPATLAYLVEAENLSLKQRFSEQVQDQLALKLLNDAGWQQYQAHEMPIKAFMDRIAKVWAGFPLENGKSAYDGLAGNRAVITRAHFETAMNNIFGERS